jgi:hypothetical protein
MRIRLCLFATVLLWSSNPLFADTPTDFSGEWLAAGPSDDAASKAPAADTTTHAGERGAGGHGRGMGGAGGAGGHHGGRHGTDAGATSSSTAAATTVANPRLHAHTLIIRQSEVVFDIAADGQRVAYRFDNRNNYGAQYGGTVNLTWSTPEMVIELHPDSGGSMEEHYSLSSDGRKLTLRLRAQHNGADTREVIREFVRSGSNVAPAGNAPILP